VFNVLGAITRVTSDVYWKCN